MSAVTTWDDVDVVIDLQSRLGEGPLWDHRMGVVVWVDILAGLVHQTDPGSGVTTTIPVGTDVGAIALHGESGYLLAVRTGFATLEGDRVEVTNEVLEADGQRMNDGALDPAGRFVAGSITNDRTPTGALYVRELDGDVRTLFGGVTVSNGLAWSAAGDRLFYVDSPLQSIDVMDYDVETGTVSGRRPWATVPESEGIPDGLTIDDEGCLWLALFGGGKVLRYSREGRVVGQVDLPVSRVTSCAFGGPDLDRLFITTAGVGSSPDDPPRPHDGALFVVEPGVIGVPSAIAPGKP
jgi:sugar lactone lactonase YvrE